MNDATDRQTPRVGRPARITREAVGEAALAIGLDNVTMKAVAERLEVDHSSLYRHVKSRDDLLFLAADLAIERLQWRNAATDWRSYLETIAQAVWRLYQTYPGLAELLRGLDRSPPSGTRAFAETVARLEEFGFAATDAVLILDSIMDMTVDSASGWRRMASRLDNGRNIGESMLTSWRSAAQTSPAFEPQIEAMAQVMTGEPSDWWHKKLDLILAGAATRLRP